MEKAINEVHKAIDENLTFRTKERLTVIKEYMTPDDMCSYFGFKDKRQFLKWEENGLKTIKLSEKSKLYAGDDVRDYLDNLRS
ncbi:hypothetical protein [Anaerococcus tetradius]|uniref:DNA-binding protein n=1 Tax=Anaerococcus tetradius TaxID=33036 RepID=A0A133KD76_9FIRM|nr:hypothetical protein [Anaerococcus tetradius]KWZ77437.1 hypothetical protein HMPREF3200_01430 [Anaerococcus tetradius]